MCVTVQAEGLLPGDEACVVVLDAGGTVGEAARLLPLARYTGLMIIVNGRLAQWETALRDGDVVELIPALGGG